MQKIADSIKNTYHDSPDLIVREIKLSLTKKITIIYLESVCDATKINNYIYLNIHDKAFDLNSLLGGPHTEEIKEKEFKYYLSNGYTLVIYRNNIFAIETKANIIRSISPPETQVSINGPKDSFNESYQVNLGLIRRRIKSSELHVKEFTLGRLTKTLTGVIYMDNIVEDESVKRVLEIIDKIDIDAIIDSSNIAEFIEEYDTNSYLPKTIKTERPDYVASSLLNGKIGILCDNSPFVLLVPVFVIDFINPILDNYSRSKGINHVKILRFFCLIITLLLPALYIAFTNYNQESIPTNILINFATERQGVPFSSIIEAFIMLITYEILRESDIRFPSNYGSAISILGALILGEASVKAGIVSPIMIIIIAITFISSLLFTDIDFINAIRHYRFSFLLLASFLGLFGIILGTIYFLTNLCSATSIGKPVSFPVTPPDFSYFKNSVIKLPLYKQFRRSKLLTKKNIIKQR